MTQAVKRHRRKHRAKRYHPKVMEHLMKQAQAEDYRREQLAELERSASRHLSDF